MGGTSLDLHRLFVEVTSRGGIEKVALRKSFSINCRKSVPLCLKQMCFVFFV